MSSKFDLLVLKGIFELENGGGLFGSAIHSRCEFVV
jgi:hypothetical protein